MRQFLVTLYASNSSHRDVAIVHEGQARPMQVRSPWLVACGQMLDVKVVVSEITHQEPGLNLIDATDLRRVVIAPTYDYRFIPSNRPLWQILEDVVQHGVDQPSHGKDCACMGKFSYEIKRHVSRILPTDAPFGSSQEWQDSFDARMRIRHILRMVENVL